MAPRIFCVAATEAPVVAVFRRGPSHWAHIGRWDLDAGRYEPGAWLRGRVFPRRSDLSPDGKYLCYFAHQPDATWEHGDAYVAVSRLPWLRALHAFPTTGTWTRGYRFTTDGTGDVVPGLPTPYRLNAISVEQFATERRRGWTEAADSPRRHPDDMWDERRNARLCKPQPHGSHVLRVHSVGSAGGEFDQGVDGLHTRYSLEFDDRVIELAELQWADWTTDGRLLVATRAGVLEIREVDGDKAEVVFAADLAGLDPSPQAAPAWARQW